MRTGRWHLGWRLMLITCGQSEMGISLPLLRQFIADAQHMSGIYESAMKMINSSASRAALSLLWIAHRIMAIHYLEIYPALVRKFRFQVNPLQVIRTSHMLRSIFSSYLP